MGRRINYIHLFVFQSVICLAQDIHFSQFNENPSMVNPALTGVANPMRASLTYKDQWRSVSSPYKSFGISFETRFNSDGWQQVDKFRSMTFKERSVGRLAWGLSVYGDQAGTGNLGSTLGNFSLATFVPTSKKSFISVGLQASLIQRRIENGNLIFPSQFSGRGYDPNLPQNEKFSAQNYNYFGFAGGFLWSYGQEEKRIATNSMTKGKFGFSFYHLSLPHEGFFASKQTAFIKYVVHGDLLYAPANFNSSFIPSFIFQMQGSSMELIVGTLVKYYFHENSKYTGISKRSSIGYGVYYRNMDAFIIAFNYENQEQYTIGLSYDVNTSRLTSASYGRGGFEISLKYTPPKAYLYQKKDVAP